jgi:hypothetical protein
MFEKEGVEFFLKLQLKVFHKVLIYKNKIVFTLLQELKMFHSFEPLDIISSHTFDSGTMF